VIRSSIGGVLVLALILCARARADELVQDPPEPPVRLKKKVKAQADPAPEQKPVWRPQKSEERPVPPKAGAAKGNAEPGENLEEKVQEIIHRLSKNLGLAEERLNNKDPGEGTQQVQRDIAKDLKELIAETQRRQQQPSASSSSSPGQRSQQARGMQNQSRLQPHPMNQLQQPTGTNRSGGTSARGEMSKIADLYKDIWGHLPEMLRQEMDQYSREQFMAKYQELLKQYYATIAEKGRRKSEP
jgi:hypothetical protein